MQVSCCEASSKAGLALRRRALLALLAEGSLRILNIQPACLALREQSYGILALDGHDHVHLVRLVHPASEVFGEMVPQLCLKELGRGIPLEAAHHHREVGGGHVPAVRRV
eukprot:scaffold54116_cov57-Phaeocystis_antarctica.AAC.2